MKKNILLGVSCLLAGILVALAASHFYGKSRQPERTAVWRGREVARQNGCFNCHGAEGVKGIPNPGYQYEEVPAWQGQTTMMFLKDSSEIRQYVLNGKPDRKEEKAEGLLHMPSFEGTIKGQDLEDLILYLKAVMQQLPLPGDSMVQKGHAIAQAAGCFGCHGPYGLGGGYNPHSFKGFIPGWDGPAFDELVHDSSELRSWILDGKIKRLEDSRLARHFTSQQTIRMPAYRNYLQGDSLSMVMAYIRYLRGQKKSWQ